MTAAGRQPGGRRYIGVLAGGTARRLQRLVGPYRCTIETCRPEMLLETLNAPTHVCTIIDPAQLGPSELDAVITRLRERPRAAVVYAQPFQESVNRAISITRATGAAVMFESDDEDTALLVHTIVSLGPPIDAAMLLTRLAPALEQLPPNLRAAITGMFAGDAAPESPDSLARRAGMSRRSLDRWLAHAGISSTRLIIAAPLLLRAFRLLHETNLPLRIIARAAELRTTSRLRDSAIDLVGLTPHQIRAGGRSMVVLIEAAAMALHGDARRAR